MEREIENLEENLIKGDNITERKFIFGRVGESRRAITYIILNHSVMIYDDGRIEDVRKIPQYYCPEKNTKSYKSLVKLCAYIGITEDFEAGTLLSEIMYQFSFHKSALIFKDGNYWFAKRRNRENWDDEIRMSPKQYDNAVGKLKEKGLVETKLYKFDAILTTHIRPIYENINTEINKWKDMELKIINE